jgi:molybdate transport system permease protein
MKSFGTSWRIWMLGAPLLALLGLPLMSLLMHAPRADVWSSLGEPSVLAALGLSVRTSIVSTMLIGLFGAPLAYWLAHTRSRLKPVVLLAVDVPLLLPPSVTGLALLLSFGAQGWAYGALSWLGFELVFSPLAVICAQTVVAAPFFIHAARLAFARLDPHVVWVARTLGQTPWQATRSIMFPLVWPGLLSGLAMSWARAMGEFGATLVVAGNLPGHTQTMPLAIYSAMNLDMSRALALSLLLSVVALSTLGLLRTLSSHATSRSMP